MLNEGEKVEMDEGYSGDFYTRTPSDFEGNQDWKIMKGRAMAHHETINGLFKHFNVLNSTYHGDRDKHYLIFHAIACIIQNEISNGHLSHEVNYDVVRQVEW